MGGNSFGDYVGRSRATEIIKSDTKCIVHFRPTKNYNGEFGFDWFRDKKDGDIGYLNTLEESKNFYSLENEYRPLLLTSIKGEINRGKLTKDDGTSEDDFYERYHSSFISLWPATIGLNSAILQLQIEALEDMNSDIEFKFESEFIDVNPKTIPKIKKTKKGKTNDDFTITVTYTHKEGYGSEQIIEVLTTSNTQKDTQGNLVKYLSGRLFIMPNDLENRYRRKVQLVQVLLDEKDKVFFNSDKIFNGSNIKMWLTGKAFNHCLVKPDVNTEIIALSMLDKYETIKSNLVVNPDVKAFGDDKFLIEGREKDNRYLKDFMASVEEEYKSHLLKHKLNNENQLVVFFVNLKVISKYKKEGEDPAPNPFSNAGGSVTTLGGGSSVSRNWGTTNGFSNTPGRYSLIFKNGITQSTINHEGLHTLGMNHPFEDRKYQMKEYETDNIMDYAPEGTSENETNKKYHCTYHRQWEKVWNRKDYVIEYVDDGENITLITTEAKAIELEKKAKNNEK